jgi:hypothetical protein
VSELSLSNSFCGIEIAAFGDQTGVKICRSEITNMAREAIQIGQIATMVVNEVFLTDVTVGSCGPGIALYFATGIYAENVSLFGCKAGAALLVAPGNISGDPPGVPSGVYGQGVYGAWFSRCIFDSSHTNNMMCVGTGQGKVWDVVFTRCSMNNSRGNGVSFLARVPVRQVAFTVCDMTQNALHGLSVADGSDSRGLQVSNSTFMNNSKGSPGASSGIAIGRKAGHFQVTACWSGYGGVDEQINTAASQKYGMLVHATAMNYIVTSNLWYKNLADGDAGFGKGAGQVVANNLTVHHVHASWPNE